MYRYDEIKDIFERNSNEENAIKMKKYLKNHFEFFGINSTKRKLLYKDFLKEEKKKGTIDWNLLERFWDDEHREFQYFVLDYLQKMQNVLTYEDIEGHIYNFAKTKQWWDSIDGLDTIIGKIGLKDKRVDDLMLSWSKDSDFWLRRIAIDHQLLRKDKTNKDLLEQIIKNNLNQNDFFINKAIGRSLRDYSKTNPAWVIEFIEINKDDLSALSIKEGLKYIERKK